MIAIILNYILALSAASASPADIKCRALQDGAGECIKIESFKSTVEARTAPACEAKDSRIECYAKQLKTLKLNYPASLSDLVDFATHAAASDVLSGGCNKKSCSYTLVDTLLGLITNTDIVRNNSSITKTKSHILELAYDSLKDMHAVLPVCRKNCAAADRESIRDYSSLNEKYLKARRSLQQN